jgi:rod shape-determining protein MreD
MTDRAPRLLIAVSLLTALVLQLFELPDALAILRPMWVPLVLAYWVMAIPRPTGLLTAWIIGFLLDVLLGSALGQHALGLTLVVFMVLQLRGLLVLYPVWQEALVLTPVWALYAFLMFWIDGATGHMADPLRQWLPVVTTGLCWPLVVAAMNSLRRRRPSDPSQL